MAEFQRVARAKGWRVAIAGASSDSLADYAVLGFKSLVLKDTSLLAIGSDIGFLIAFSILAMGIATLLFKRTL
jgi:hypothetical protein